MCSSPTDEISASVLKFLSYMIGYPSSVCLLMHLVLERQEPNQHRRFRSIPRDFAAPRPLEGSLSHWTLVTRNKGKTGAYKETYRSLLR